MSASLALAHSSPLPALPYTLELFDKAPWYPHCQAHLVDNDSLEPIIPRGSIVFYEQGNFYPVDGALIITWSVLQRSSCCPQYVDLRATQVFQSTRNPDHWYCGAVHRPRSNEEAMERMHRTRVFTCVDGPYSWESMTAKTHGRIIGMLNTTPMQ